VLQACSANEGAGGANTGAGNATGSSASGGSSAGVTAGGVDGGAVGTGTGASSPDATASGTGNTSGGSGFADAPIDHSDAAANDASLGSIGPSDARMESSLAEAGGDPTLLSQAGLYSDIVAGTLANGVFPYHPQFALWADGATKKRWVKLPPGKQIDTTDMDFWMYPAGTKLFKEFSVNGVRLETRLVYKRGDNDFYYMAFQWNAGQTEAFAVPNGVVNASGTTHDIPSQNDCETCHEQMVDRILGFSALQLAHPLSGPTDPEVNLEKIASMGWLTSAPPAASAITVPGDAIAQAALGYMHANCGMCHNYRSFVYMNDAPMDLWLQTSNGQLATLETTTTYLALVDQPTTTAVSGLTYRVVPGQPALSAVHLMMSLRKGGSDVDGSVAMRQMPPLATKVVDATGLAQVDAWIREVHAPSDAGSER
jgi:hypothetical protein